MKSPFVMLVSGATTELEYWPTIAIELLTALTVYFLLFRFIAVLRNEANQKD